MKTLQFPSILLFYKIKWNALPKQKFYKASNQPGKTVRFHSLNSANEGSIIIQPTKLHGVKIPKDYNVNNPPRENLKIMKSYKLK
jgi:hypothetical protein